MADLLTAAQRAAYTRHKMRPPVVRSAVVSNAAISPTDISDRVKKWGSVQFSVYNVHPQERGSLRFPVVELTVDNRDGYFDRGGVIFPNGVGDLASSMLTVSVLAGGVALFAFEGRILQPEYPNGGTLQLVAEHPLAAMSSRRWAKGDRIGGDTGIDWYFT